jgi:DNA-binding MarR family transcriptional regulator
MSSDVGHGELSPERQRLLAELLDEVRGDQRATDVVDELAAELLGINRTDSRCLDILEQRGRVSAGELADAARLTTGAVTAVIDRLERVGFARRVTDPEDRRRVLVEITPKARAATEELMAPLGEAGFPLLQRYTDEQLRWVIEFERTSRELQERHAEWLRERLATARARRRPGSRTERA